MREEDIAECACITFGVNYLWALIMLDVIGSQVAFLHCYTSEGLTTVKPIISLGRLAKRGSGCVGEAAKSLPIGLTVKAMADPVQEAAAINCSAAGEIGLAAVVVAVLASCARSLPAAGAYCKISCHTISLVRQLPAIGLVC